MQSKFSYAYASKHDPCEYYSEKYLQINKCGALKVENRTCVSDRPARIDYMLIYLIEGTGHAFIDGEKQILSSGDLLLLKPGAPLHFEFNKHSQHFWIHFTGSATQEMLSECGITQTGIYNVGVSDKLWELLTDIYIHISYSSTGSSHITAKSIFLKLLGELANILVPSEKENEVIREKKIYPALKEMNINFDKNHKLEYYANICGISLSSFQHIFTKVTGTTPQKYLTSIRIDIAKKQLLSTDDSVKEVALFVGYEDPLYFSRLFKKYVGISPRGYATKNSAGQSHFSDVF